MQHEDYSQEHAIQKSKVQSYCHGIFRVLKFGYVRKPFYEPADAFEQHRLFQFFGNIFIKQMNGGQNLCIR